MRKYILVVLIILLPLFLTADFVYGPKVDYQGRPSNSGKPLFEWFNPTQPDWRNDCFFASNKKLIAWEIEKMFKELTFKVDFFSKPYAGLGLAMFYLRENPPGAKKLIELASLYYEYGDKKNDFISIENLEYILMKEYPLWKEKIENSGRSNLSGMVKKYDKIYAKQKFLTVNELRKKAYDNYMRTFKKSNDSYGGRFEIWLENWNPQNIILDILKQKAVTDKNIYTFVNLLDNLDNIPDDVAEKIIQYFKLNTPSPQVSLASLWMLGKNPKLTKAVLKNFKYIKRPQNFSDYYSAAAMLLNYKIPDEPGRWVERFGFCIKEFLIYARVSGDYNAAFKKYTQQKAAEKDYLPGGLAFLEPGSNLNMLTAEKILNSNVHISEGTETIFSEKFAKLLKPRHFKAPRVGELPLGMFFPFKSLTPYGQKSLLKTYILMLQDKNFKRSHQAVLKALLAINSPEYKRKAIEFLMQTPSHENDKALQSLSLACIPELLEIAGGKDPELGVKACQLIGMNSVLGMTAAKGLKDILKNTEDFSVKIAAICALAEIGDKESIPLIKKSFNDKNRLLARAARQAVFMLQPLDKNDALFKEMLQAKKR